MFQDDDFSRPEPLLPQPPARKKVFWGRKWYSIVLYCNKHGEIVDGEVLRWDSKDDAYGYLFACKEDDKYFADGAVVEKPPCLSCRWRCQGHEGDPASYCRNDEAPRLTARLPAGAVCPAARSTRITPMCCWNCQ